MEGYVFSPTGQGAPTPQELQRRRITAEMARPSPLPTTVGGGLAALGEAYGSRHGPMGPPLSSLFALPGLSEGGR